MAQTTTMLSLDKFVKSLKSHPLDVSVEHLISLFKRRQISGSKPCAIATIHIIRQVVAKASYKDVDKLIEKVQRVGQRLVRAQPHELVVGNVVRRVLGLIRDEAGEDRTEFGIDSVSDLQSLTPADVATQREPAAPALPVLNRAPTITNMGHGSFSTPFSMLSLLSSPSDYLGGSGAGSPMGMSGSSTPLGHGQSGSIHSLRSEVIEGIDEIMDEIEQVDDLIAGHAEIQIHPTDYILVHEPDSTTERFLLRASQKRRFTVLMVRGHSSVSKDGAGSSSFEKKLRTAGVKAVNVTNAGLMAYMTRVDKVVLSARCVTADGGVVAESGAMAAARAAREFGKPVVVLMGIYKLSSENPADLRSLVEWGAPESYVNFSQGKVVEKVHVEAPVTDFVPPDLVDTYVSNIGMHSRDHLHGLIGDHYNDQDLEFHIAPL